MTKSHVLFEVGLEEMPARFLNDVEQQLEKNTKEWLSSLRLTYTKLNTYITPRRFAVTIENIAEKQPDIEEEAKGPAEKIALNEDGSWSKAAIGFSKGQGKTVDDIYFKEVKGTNYVFVKKFIEGQSTDELLVDFKKIILGIQFPKNMRWSNQTLRYIRPIKWLVAMKNTQVIPFEIVGVKTSNISYGHRFLSGEIRIDDSKMYVEKLREAHVIASAEERQEMITDQIEQLEKEKGWKVKVERGLLNEVTHLVEFPTASYGTFDEKFLDIPSEVLITSMQEHQRYFPVESLSGGLLPFFVFVRNGDDHAIKNVAKGNEKVLRARLADAQFFYDEDQKQEIETNVTKLNKTVFQEKLGTIGDKTERVKKITRLIAERLELTPQKIMQAERAASIYKFDLVTNMVNEFTELQGIMGEKYALIHGEDPAVAKAIVEHYLPRHANDNLPESTLGAIISVADKLDTIVGCFAIGLIPSGSQDPYALRRQALGVLEIVKEYDWDFSLENLLIEVKEILIEQGIELTNKEAVVQDLVSFFKARTAYILKELGVSTDLTEALISSELGNISFMVEKAQILRKRRTEEAFKEKQEAFVRVLNIAKKNESPSNIDNTLFENKEEEQLYNKWTEIKPKYYNQLENLQASEALNTLSELTNSIHEFFEDTMVMTENNAIRLNRLNLLTEIAKGINAFADLTKVQWKQQK
ncbi:glycine--tRNA ligase subunit beta [Saliterribacillus persicus]|uniref:Glycine--tRNA ligase beta subunit n=1 Tax=Saliterribacillus persicus TaxID=930114 RepID=A0A368XBJ2_9BACI|nr:glycine--tRNA ligase subunit beta [Saliterribacillus persicus]RCW65341.1 glycyl-tRNA synthetase beta chain [Saliterribacillus persicus]